MASSLPKEWDEAEFIEEVSRRPELFDISNELYSNNKHCWYIFRQIGVIHNVDGKLDTVTFICIHLYFSQSKYIDFIFHSQVEFIR